MERKGTGKRGPRTEDWGRPDQTSAKILPVIDLHASPRYTGFRRFRQSLRFAPSLSPQSSVPSLQSSLLRPTSPHHRPFPAAADIFAPCPPPPHAPKLWLHHLADEADAAFLYRELAAGEPDPKKSALYSRLSEVENRHVGVWQKLLTENGHSVPAVRVSVKARPWPGWRAGSARSGSSPCCSRRRARRSRATCSCTSPRPDGATGPAALRLARESKEHADTLSKIAGTVGEPWHKTQAGGFLRNVVYGFNDGLTANFGLVAGMVGAAESMGDGRACGGRGGARRHGGRRAVHGLVGIPRRQERARGVRARDRDGAGRDPSHARTRDGGAEPAVPGQGNPGGPGGRAGAAR